MDHRTGLPIVGMVGGGQLARMTHQAAIALGQTLSVLSVGPDESAARVTPDVTLGSHLDFDALAAFADGCDVLTFDHEHVPGEFIARLAAAGHEVHPGADAFIFAQDKLQMRRRLAELGVPIPRWSKIDSVAQLEQFADGQWPVVLKAARGGYDGNGVWLIEQPSEAAEIITHCTKDGIELLVEERVALRSELAAVVARSKFGQVAAWPVVQTVQQDGICVEVIAPAPHIEPSLAGRAAELAISLADRLGVTGVLAVELFEVDTPAGPGILVNELAMRPHNSGHWTIDGSVTSQFEQHLRAVLDYPLGATTARAPWTVMANVLGGQPGGPSIDERVHHLMARWPEIKVHLYGKQVRPGRKIGHVTVTGTDLPTMRRNARAAAQYLSDGQLPAGSTNEVEHTSG